MNFSIQNIIKALHILQQIKEEVERNGLDLNKWVDLVFELFPVAVKILDLFNKPEGVSATNFEGVRAKVEAVGVDFNKWIELLIKVAPLIQQLIETFKNK